MQSAALPSTYGKGHDITERKGAATPFTARQAPEQNIVDGIWPNTASMKPMAARSDAIPLRCVMMMKNDAWVMATTAKTIHKE
jgi:hypothetical protein